MPSLTEASTKRIVLLLLAVVIGMYLLVALVGVVACVYFRSECGNVDFRYYLGEPLSALLGLLGGRVLSDDK